MKKLFLLLVLFLTQFNHSQAQEEKYIGLYVYNFTKFFDWPEIAKYADFKIQVIGHKSVFEELKSLTAGKSVGHRNIVVEQIASTEEISNNTNILFIGHWQTRHLANAVQLTSNHPILLVTEFEGLLQKGSAINFIIREGKIMFELNITNAKAGGIKIDPRLKELAYSVVE